MYRLQIADAFRLVEFAIALHWALEASINH